jgi:H+-translocating NAD(P) transhydrogenase subunit alpha
MPSIKDFEDSMTNLNAQYTECIQAKDKCTEALAAKPAGSENNDHFISGLSIFVMACVVGYYVVWRVTPALHTPLMAVTNAISGIIIVGAVIAAGAEGAGISDVLGFLAALIASVNIFGGFVVTQRMLAMFKKKG